MRRDRIIRGHLRHRLIISMRDGLTWDALVMDADDRLLILREASVVRGEERLPADGEVLIHRADVAYMQTIPEMQRR
jgi:hypothetical protein